MYRSDKEKTTNTNVVKASTVLNSVLLIRRNFAKKQKRGYEEKPIKPQRNTSKAVNFHQPGVDSSAG